MEFLYSIVGHLSPLKSGLKTGLKALKCTETPAIVRFDRAWKSCRMIENRNLNGALTTAAVTAGDSAQVMPEFGRWQDVERIFGIKRGTLYTLVAEGKVKTVSLRRKGAARGCRLFYLQSVRELLVGLMQAGSK